MIEILNDLKLDSPFSFASGFSLYVDCEDQSEVDRLFTELASDRDPERAMRTINAIRSFL